MPTSQPAPSRFLTMLVWVLQVVTATCVGAGDRSTLGYRRFRIVIIDEASQSTEPSSLIPLVSPCRAGTLFWLGYTL